MAQDCQGLSEHQDGQEGQWASWAKWVAYFSTRGIGRLEPHGFRIDVRNELAELGALLAGVFRSGEPSLFFALNGIVAQSHFAALSFALTISGTLTFAHDGTFMMDG